MVIVAQTLVVAGCATLLTVAMVRTQGTFSYSLDDPYIHLALSEQLALGHYGLHPDAPSAPSSSILWPWLLAPAAATPWHALMPLILNGIALLWVLSLLRQLLGRCGLLGAGRHHLFAAGWIVLFSALINLPFLISTGMEHTLQVALALAVVRGLLDLESDAPTPRGTYPLLLFALAVGPLVRYESLALSLAAILFLVLRRRYLLAAAAGLLTLIPPGLFSWALLDMGLPPLPSSVLSKSGLATSLDPSTSWMSVLDATVLENLSRLPEISGARQLATLLGILWATALWQRRKQRPALPACLGLALLAHLLLGRFAPNERYEMYLLAAGGMLLLHGLRHHLRQLLSRHSALSVLLGLTLITLPWQAKTLKLLAQTPAACHNIYQQQFQMHRFVTEYYRGPVAVNDLGWVSYRNP